MGTPWTHIHRARKHLRKAEAMLKRGDLERFAFHRGKVERYETLTGLADARDQFRLAPRASAHDAALIARAAHGTEVARS